MCLPSWLYRTPLVFSLRSQREHGDDLSEPFSEHKLNVCCSVCIHYEGLSIAPACGKHPPPPSPLSRGQALALHPRSLPIGPIDRCLVPLGLLSLHPLQRWLNSLHLNANWHRTIEEWRERACQGVSLLEVVKTDTRLSGRGAVWENRTVWTRSMF